MRGLNRSRSEEPFRDKAPSLIVKGTAGVCGMKIVFLQVICLSAIALKAQDASHRQGR